MLAAVPLWINENVAIGSLVVLVLIAIVVLRYVRKAMTRVLVIAILIGMGATIYGQRNEIRQCGSSCRCELFATDIRVPGCSPRFPAD